MAFNTCECFHSFEILLFFAALNNQALETSIWEHLMKEKDSISNFISIFHSFLSSQFETISILCFLEQQ